MIYTTELYYWQDPEFSFEKALRVTVEAITPFAKSYEATLIAPEDRKASKERHGLLPEDAVQKQNAMREVLDWIISASSQRDLFSLFISSEEATSHEKINLFDHHDDTCCWALNLSKMQFIALQEMWKQHDLPTDLFFPEDEGTQIGNYYYTPKQLEAPRAKQKGQ